MRGAGAGAGTGGGSGRAVGVTGTGSPAGGRSRIGALSAASASDPTAGTGEDRSGVGTIALGVERRLRHAPLGANT